MMKINEQQLENVARAIYESDPYSKPQKEPHDPPTGEMVKWEDISSHKKDSCRKQAKAAIEAAFKPLPIEDAQKDGAFYLLVGGSTEESEPHKTGFDDSRHVVAKYVGVDDFWDGDEDFYEAEEWVYCYWDSAWRSNYLNPTGFIPFPEED